MGVKTVTVGVRRLINLGNYENVTYECIATGDVAEGQNPDEIYNECLDFAKTKIGLELDRFTPKKGKK